MTENTEDGRVTLAVLSNKLDVVLSNQYDAKVERKEYRNRIDCLERNDSVQSEKISQLERKVNSWTFVNSLGVVGATITAIILGKS